MRQYGNVELEFVYDPLRYYLAAVYMKNENFIINKILENVYSDSAKNENILNAVRLLVGIEEQRISNVIIKEFIDNDVAIAYELFAISSINKYEKEVVDLIEGKINSFVFISSEMMYLFYSKVIDLMQKSAKFNDPKYAYYLVRIGILYSVNR